MEIKQGGSNPLPSDIQGNAWPPPPSVPHSPPTKGVQRINVFLTKDWWLDAILGLPAGFLASFVCYIIVSLASQAVHPPPFSSSRMWFNLVAAAVLNVLICIIIGRKYLLFGVMVAFGSAIMFLILLFFTWFGSGMPNY